MYKLTRQGEVIIRLDDHAFIPCDEGNMDYRAYQDWVQAGNKPEPADEEPVLVPQEITRAQGKSILIIEGLWNGVLAFVAGIEDPTEKALAEIALHDTVTWRRDSPFLARAGAALNLTDEQLDQMFIVAAQINP